MASGVATTIVSNAKCCGVSAKESICTSPNTDSPESGVQLNAPVFRTLGYKLRSYVPVILAQINPF